MTKHKICTYVTTRLKQIRHKADINAWGITERRVIMLTILHSKSSKIMNLMQINNRIVQNLRYSLCMNGSNIWLDEHFRSSGSTIHQRIMWQRWYLECTPVALRIPSQQLTYFYSIFRQWLTAAFCTKTQRISMQCWLRLQSAVQTLQNP
jgi:hypothetical protein